MKEKKWKSKYGKIIGIVIFITIFLQTTVQASANIKTYKFKTEEKNITSEKLINNGTIQYSKPSSIYDFIDENGKYNTVYTSEKYVYWSTFDSNMKEIKNIKIPMYFDKSNSPEVYKDIVFNFGNALYYNEHLYIVYGRQASTATSNRILGCNNGYYKIW